MPGVTKRTSSSGECTVLIESRTFFRECVLASLQAIDPTREFVAFESVPEWAQSHVATRTSLLVQWASGKAPQDEVFSERLRQVVERPGSPPVAVMSDCEDAELIAHVMNGGARAFLPAASMGIEIVAKVLELVRAGGTFIPASTLAAAPAADEVHALTATEQGPSLSPRQLEVAHAISRGLPNKLIAHELDMSEGTVKVHVKHILRKLNAKNRTQVAIRLRKMEDRP
ncbi:DNA-binding response regulator [Chelatococcus reniformis]|uniref:DNA-binding response regulator n=1 Tax=Chelatococcus reniformis TaxID=1494448 RepID=A0A916X9N1_9HYPH|nr:DNA-binding response regulator [Chelatococcus reniformis]